MIKLKMAFLILVAISFLATSGLCAGFNLKILMHRLDNVESRLEKQIKIHLQEMTAIHEKMSVINSLEANVKMLMEIVVGKDSQLFTGFHFLKEDNPETKDRSAEIRDLRNVMFNAFHREKERNVKFRKDYKRLKVKIFRKLNSQFLNLSNAVNDMTEKINEGIKYVNLTVINPNSMMDNVENQINKSTDLKQEIITRIKQVEEIIAQQGHECDMVSQLNNTIVALSEKQDTHWDIISKPISCEIQNQLGHTSGVFKIWHPSYQTKLRVYCDQETDGGGWIVFQRRRDGTVDFNRDWNDYKLGFGDLNSEFWLGNEHLSRLTSEETHELRIDLEDFDGNKAYAKYKKFKIHSEDEWYRLRVGGYSGNAGDAMEYHNRKFFSTKDNWRASPFCEMLNAGWWFGHCSLANLNGEYYKRFPPKIYLGVTWFPWIGTNATIKFSEMKFRRKSSDK